MESRTLEPLFRSLENRRQSLHMSVEDLARRSSVSRATVGRILSGRHAEVSVANLAAVAQALGVSLRVEESLSADEFREREAAYKALYLVGKAQGTMALEAQGVGQEAIDREVRRTTHALLAGSPRRLWGI